MHLLPPNGPPLTPAELLSLYQTDKDQQLVRMNFVSSFDGAVEVDGLSEGLGGDADKQVFGMLRGMADGILVGAGTMRAEHYRAVRPTAARREWRRSVGLAEYPRLVVVSGSLDLDPAQAAFADAPVRPVVITHGSADDERRDAISTVADVLVHGVDRVDMVAALAELRRRYGLNHVLCEGGPSLFGSLQAANLVDEVCLTLSPLMAGAGSGRIISGPRGTAQRMALKHAIASDGYLLLRYVRTT
jgi:riboflavin biosynthesis pyrimidine reductase